jgi:hypothetical protein
MQKILGSLVVVLISSACSQADFIEVSITNLAPNNGTYLTPVFLGAHDGSFGLFTPGLPASAGLERIAEDGGPQTLLLNSLLAAGGVGGTAGTGPIAPGETVKLTLDLNPLTQRYLSYASMIIPSNDAFIGNPSPTLFTLFDNNGQLITRQGAGAFRVLGTQVWDAGTEVNDEIPANTAFLGQSVPDTGVNQNGVVALHPGFQGSQLLGGPPGNILSDSRFSAADFSQPSYVVAQIEVSAVPAPPAVILLGLGMLSAAVVRRMRRIGTS